jgi:tRNA threonylcarbamoyladenosine modification (KEOPS) complex Cgi121 subunit
MCLSRIGVNEGDEIAIVFRAPTYSNSFLVEHLRRMLDSEAYSYLWGLNPLIEGRLKTHEINVSTLQDA